MSCLGDLERGRGGSLASEFGGSCSRVDLACFHGKTLAGLLGGSVWRVKLAHLFSGFLKQGKHMLLNKEKK